MHPASLFRFIAACMLLAPLPAVASEAKSDQFWTTDALHTIELRVTPQRWQMMQPIRSKQGRPRISASAMPRPTTQPSAGQVLKVVAPSTQPVQHRDGERLDPNFYGMEFAYVHADFACDGIELKDIALRFRGNSSFNWNAASGYKRPYKVDFNRYVEGQKFCGLNGFFLNNNAYDPSQLRETLAYETFRKLGVPAPRTTFALVYLTIDGRVQRECLGVYTLIEDIDTKVFLKRNFDSSKGFLLKPWSIRGLPYMGEQWKAYESHYNPRTDPTPQTAARTIEFVKLVNYSGDAQFAAQIEQYLDVDGFLRLLAGDVMLSNLDTFLYTGHNFYMYLSPKDNRFHFMPWDMNLSFANFTSAATVEEHLHLSIIRPHIGEMILIDRLMAIPKYNEAYRKIIRDAMETHFSPAHLFPRIEHLQTVLKKADQQADADWKARFTPATTQPSTRPVRIPPRPIPRLTGWRGEPAIALDKFITRRIESLNAQLAGETDGFVPGYRPFPSPPRQGLRAAQAYGNLPLLAFAAMQGADSNYDYKLTRDEYTAAIRAFLSATAATRPTFVDQTKLTKSLTPLIQQVFARQRQRDRERNRDRDRRGPASAEAPQLWASAIMRAVDAGNLSAVPLDQVIPAAERAFAAADQDKSNKLDPQELLLLMDQLAAGSAQTGVSVAPRPAGSTAKQ